MRSHLVLHALLPCALALPLIAQQAGPDEPAPPAAKDDIGLPALPPVTADSPQDSIFFADRRTYGEPGDTQQAEAGDGATLVSFTIPKSITGTAAVEPIVYQLPVGYDGQNPTPYPLVVAYHGFGGSAWSPSNQSTIHEECNNRGWIYMAPTGYDDQLFGSPVPSQQHTEVAIQWMLDSFHVDPDRIYMIGFSMGGGIALNFASRHREPDGIMIAAVGVVSAALDWTMTYNRSTPENQLWMENPLNFGGPPSTHGFNYQQASVLHMDEASYPPYPGSLLPTLTMGTNLGSVPVYITYDDQDPIGDVPPMNEELATLLTSLGGTVQKTVVSGTEFPGPPSEPAPHSWYVLDETECFDFLEGKVVDRYPEPFEAQLDDGGAVAWASVTQTTTGEFSYLDGSLDLGTNTIIVDAIDNVSDMTIDVQATGVSTWPARFELTPVQQDPVTLRLTNFVDSPSRLYYSAGATLVPLVDSDPATGSLLVDIPPGGTTRFFAIHDPTWTSVMTTSPNPALLANPMTISMDAPTGGMIAVLIIATQEAHVPIGPVIITAVPINAAIEIVPLDANGDFSTEIHAPNDPVFSGLRLPIQFLGVNSLGEIFSVSNLWGLHFE